MKTLKNQQIEADATVLNNELIELKPLEEQEEVAQIPAENQYLALISRNCLNRVNEVQAFSNQMVKDMESEEFELKNCRMKVNEEKFGKIEIKNMDEPISIMFDELAKEVCNAFDTIAA